MRTWWNRALTVLLLVTLLAGIVSVATVSRLVRDMRESARQADNDNALITALIPALYEEMATSHMLVDYGIPIMGKFQKGDSEVASLFERADSQFGIRYGQALSRVREMWLATYSELRSATATPQRLDAYRAGIRDIKSYHIHLMGEQEKFGWAIAALEDALHRNARDGLSRSQAVEREVLVTVVALSVLTIALVVALGRRLRRRVIGPIRELVEAAQEFGEGAWERRPIVDQDDELGELAGAFTTMAEAIAAQHGQLRHKAYVDTLTGLANRRALVEELDRALSTSETNYALVFVDLDDFKQVNDALGHAAGDELLRRVATRMSESARESDLVARFGGDEFAILVAAPASPEMAVSLATRVLAAVSRPLNINGETVQVAASAGVAVNDDGVAGRDELLRRADAVMYLAKGLGKNRVELYDALAHECLVGSGRLRRAVTVPV